MKRARGRKYVQEYGHDLVPRFSAGSRPFRDRFCPLVSRTKRFLPRLKNRLARGSTSRVLHHPDSLFVALPPLSRSVSLSSKIKTIFHNLPLGAWLIDFSPSVARGGKFRTNSSIRFRSIASRVSG